MNEEIRDNGQACSNVQLVRKNKITNVIIAVLLVAVILSATWLGLNVFVLVRHPVEGVSMTPTVKDGDLVWGNKLKEVQRFDVVSINAARYVEKANEIMGHGSDGITASILLKRVIGVEGDKVYAVTVGSRHWPCISRDGEEIFRLEDNEDYGGGKLEPLSYWLDGGHDYNLTTEVIPEGFVFVMGDMRGSYPGKGVSVDSRYFGLVAVEDIIAVIYGYK